MAGTLPKTTESQTPLRSLPWISEYIPMIAKPRILIGQWLCNKRLFLILETEVRVKVKEKAKAKAKLGTSTFIMC